MTTENTEVQTEATDEQKSEYRLPPQLDKESDADYRRRIREEAKKYRVTAEEWQAKFKEAEAKLQNADKAQADHQTEIEKIKAETRNQIAINKIEAVAAKEGALDTDVLEKLLDPSQFVFDENGKITNATDLVAKLKAEKPYLFGSISTASTAKAPTATDQGPRKVSQMSKEEKAAHLKKFGV